MLHTHGFSLSLQWLVLRVQYGFAPIEKCLLDTAVSGYVPWPEECGRVEQRITGWLPPQLLHRHHG